MHEAGGAGATQVQSQPEPCNQLKNKWAQQQDPV